MTVEEIFRDMKNIAVVGMSKNMMKAAYSVPAFMHSKGYNVIPVNPTADEILSKKAYNNLTEIEGQIDIVNVFRPSEDALVITQEAVQRKISRGDVKVIWLQEGIENEEARKLAEENGIHFIQDKCMYKEYANIY